MTRILFLLYGSIEFDGRVRRMQQIAAEIGEVYTLDTGLGQSATTERANHERMLLKPHWSIVRRHLSFWRDAVSAARRVRPDIIVAEDFFCSFPAFLAARTCGARLVYDAHELIVPAPGESLSWRNWFWYRLERFVAPRCDYIVAANPERAEIMQQHYGLSRKPDYMRNIPAAKQVTDAERADALTRYPALKRRSSNEKILIYQGDVSLRRGLGRFIEALEHLPSEWRLIVVGSGPDLDALKEMAAPLQAAGRFDALGRLPNQDMPAVTVHCDVGIVTYPFEGLNNIYCAPNKIYEYMLAGLPVIASNQVTIASLLNDLPYGEMFAKEVGAETLAGKIIRAENLKRFPVADVEVVALAERQSARERIDVALAQTRNAT